MKDSLKTYFIFLDIPTHIEWLASPTPILEVKDVIHFDNISFKDPRNPKRMKQVDGPYEVKDTKLIYRTKDGLIQFVTFAPVK